MYMIDKLKLFMMTSVLTMAVATPVSAMHIMEGYLPPLWCVAWFVLCAPAVILGVMKITKLLAKNPQMVVMLAMAGAFAFVLSALKIPSVTGSTSHMTGLGFATILFGPTVASVLAVIILLFQALLLAHGGLTTLGANTFSMGVMGPLVCYLVYVGLKSIKCPIKISVFIAVALGDLMTYVVTAFQLAAAHPSPEGGFTAAFAKLLSVFAITQIPLAIIEGALTIVLINIIGSYAKDLFVQLGKGELVYE